MLTDLVDVEPNILPKPIPDELLVLSGGTIRDETTTTGSAARDLERADEREGRTFDFVLAHVDQGWWGGCG